MDKKNNRGFIRPRMFLIAFGIILYMLLQDTSKISGYFSWAFNVVAPVLYGLCIAFVMNVLMTNLEKLLLLISKKKLRGTPLRIISVSLTVILLLGAFVALSFVVVPAVTDTVSMLISYIPQSSTEITSTAEDLLTYLKLSPAIIASLTSKIGELLGQLQSFLQSEIMGILNAAYDVTTSLLSVVTTFIIALIFAIYVLAGKEKIGAFANDAMRRFIPEKITNTVIDIGHLSYSAFANFVKGQLLEACILGVLCFIGMVIFQFPNAAVVSLMVGITALIPIVGAFIGAFISALLILIVSPMKALFFLIYILVLQQIEGNLIYPRVVGQTIGLPGIIVLAAVTIGGNIAGIPGMLIGVPMCSVLYTLLRRAVYNHA